LFVRPLGNYDLPVIKVIVWNAVMWALTTSEEFYPTTCPLLFRTCEHVYNCTFPPFHFILQMSEQTALLWLQSLTSWGWRINEVVWFEWDYAQQIAQVSLLLWQTVCLKGIIENNWFDVSQCLQNFHLILHGILFLWLICSGSSQAVGKDPSQEALVIAWQYQHILWQAKVFKFKSVTSE